MNSSYQKTLLIKWKESHTSDKIYSIHIPDSNLLVSKIYKQLLLFSDKNWTTQLQRKKTWLDLKRRHMVGITIWKSAQWHYQEM